MHTLTFYWDHTEALIWMETVSKPGQTLCQSYYILHGSVTLWVIRQFTLQTWEMVERRQIVWRELQAGSPFNWVARQPDSRNHFNPVCLITCSTKAALQLSFNIPSFMENRLSNYYISCVWLAYSLPSSVFCNSYNLAKISIKKKKKKQQNNSYVSCRA